MTGPQVPGKPPLSGFTLVEVVVALTLLSLLLLGLVSALRSFGQTGARLEAQTLAIDDLRLVDGLLRRTIARTSPRTFQDPADQSVRTWLVGAAGGLAWLGQLPARHGIGGLNHMRLFVEPGSGASARGRLLLQMAPYTGDTNRPNWSELEPRPLLDDVDSLRLQYQAVGEEEWFDVWPEPAILPGRVRLVITVRGKAWPPIVVRLENAEAQGGGRVPGKSLLRRL